MKNKTNLGYILLILSMVSALFIFEKVRIQSRVAANKADKKVTGEAGSSNISNTDFIFFESLSKYLFIALEK